MLVVFVAVGLDVILALAPLFYGAAHGKFERGLTWTVWSFVTPGALLALGYAAFVGGMTGHSTGSTVLGLGWLMALALSSLVAALVVPALGINSISKEVSRDRARLGRASSGRHRPPGYEDDDREPCPECAEEIKLAAQRCRFCGAESIRELAERLAFEGAKRVTAPKRRRRRRR